jgi:hypothetical protein
LEALSGAAGVSGCFAAQVNWRGRLRFAAQRIVARDRPQHENAEEQRKRASDDVRIATGNLRPRLRGVWPSGAVNSSAVMDRSLSRS